MVSFRLLLPLWLLRAVLPRRVEQGDVFRYSGGLRPRDAERHRSIAHQSHGGSGVPVTVAGWASSQSSMSITHSSAVLRSANSDPTKQSGPSLKVRQVLDAVTSTIATSRPRSESRTKRRFAETWRVVNRGNVWPCFLLINEDVCPQLHHRHKCRPQKYQSHRRPAMLSRRLSVRPAPARRSRRCSLG